MTINLKFDDIDYVHGHIDPFWTDEDFKNLPYSEATKARLEEWISMGYPEYINFYGLDYNNSNPMPEFVSNFSEIFSNICNITYSFYKMTTVTIMPRHIDYFTAYKKIFGVEDNIIRILVMLEDWKPGHYLEIDDKGIVNWKAGDFFAWRSHVPHAASNIGEESNPRYTLQITATLSQ